MVTPVRSSWRSNGSKSAWSSRASIGPPCRTTRTTSQGDSWVTSIERYDGAGAVAAAVVCDVVRATLEVRLDVVSPAAAPLVAGAVVRAALEVRLDVVRAAAGA